MKKHLFKYYFFSLFAVLTTISNSYTQSDTSKIYILPGASYLTNFGGEIDNVKLAGNARFMHDSVFMNCDTAYIYNTTQSVIAIGNVVVNQGDSLFLYGDTLNYFGNTKMAYVFGNVRLVESDLTLTCDSIVYDLNTNIAKYTTGGKVVSKKNDNTLTSIKGFYLSNEQKLSFKDSVVLQNPDYIMKSDTLDYFENTEVAYFFGNTTIEGEDNFIFCKNGWYDTKNDIAQFSKDAYLISDKHKLEGDSLFYDRNLGYGKAMKDVQITDTANEIIVTGQLAEHYDKENISLVTGNPLVSKWFDDDTLFLTADTIRVFNDSSDKKNTLYAHHGVNFFKSDIQGNCDSMIYLQSDSMLRMFSNPIIWSEESQLSGDTIYVQIADNKLKEINLLDNSFIIEEVKEPSTAMLDTTFVYDSINEQTDTVINTKVLTKATNYYNQVKGKTIKGVFNNDSIRKVFVNGNGQSVYYTGDEGKPVEAVNKIICSDIVMTFGENKVSDILFLKKPEGTLYPIKNLAKNEQELEGFKWDIDKRPLSKDDLLKKENDQPTTDESQHEE